MDKKIVFLFVFVILIIAAVVFLLSQKKPDEFEIFSNMPTQNASVIMFMNFNENSFAELSNITGSLLGGGIKNIKGAEMGLTMSNDSTGIIIYVGTNETVSNVLQDARIPDYMVSTKTVSGKQVTVIDSGRGLNAICLWKDGDWLKILTTQQGVLPYLSAPGVYSLYGIKPAAGEECYDVMKSSYDTAYVRDFFSETEGFKQRITINGEYLGEMRAVIKDVNVSLFTSIPGMQERAKEMFSKPLSASGYSVFFEDSNADYGISISHSGGLAGSDKLPCYNLSILLLKQQSEIVERGGKEACLSTSEVSYGLFNIEILSVSRSVGEYAIAASAYVKGDSSKVKDYLESVVFSQDFAGAERGWSNTMSPKVRVFEGSKLQALLNSTAGIKPLEGVNVSLYTYDMSSQVKYEVVGYVAVGKGNLIESRVTNSMGEANFGELPDAIYYVDANKTGYTTDSSTIDPSTAYAELYIQPVVPLQVNVTSEGEPVSGAKVELYYSSMELINTSYTNSSGIADFGSMTVDYANVVVSKEGYNEGMSYVNQFSVMPISVKLVKSAHTSNAVEGGINTTGSPSIGNSSAKVVVVEFGDFQCPFCGEAFNDMVKPMETDYVNTGKVMFVFKNLPLQFHQYAEKAAEAAECAREQGKFWEMYDELYSNQNALTVDNLKGYAKSLGLGTNAFNQCLDKGAEAQAVQNDVDYANQLGIDSTPTFYVNEKQMIGTQPYSTFKQAIDAALAAS